MAAITVVKLDLAGVEVWRYSGEVLDRDAHSLRLRALFNRPDRPFHGILLREGDPFVEAYYSDRWYNIYQIHDRDNRAVKAWYCNVSRPAEIGAREVRYVDLALDLLVFPDGRQLTLDEDEFEALRPDAALRECAFAALAELKGLVRPERGFSLPEGDGQLPGA